VGSLARAHNKRAIREALRDDPGGILNVNEIAEATGLTPSTTRRWLNSLMLEDGVERLGRGVATQYRLKGGKANE
jgi:DNA-binding IclR family transcriptional regulator